MDEEIKGVLKEIMDEAMVQIAKQMLAIVLVPMEEGLEQDKEYHFVVTQIKGGFDFTLVMAAERSLFDKIAECMSRGKATCDVSEYAIEYFNVLCGRIISLFNRRMKTSYKFKVPEYKEDLYICSTRLEQGYQSFYKIKTGDNSIILGVYQ